MPSKRGKAPAAAEYKVSAIIDHRFHKDDAVDDDFKRAEYRVLWSDKTKTWEPYRNVKDCVAR